MIQRTFEISDNDRRDILIKKIEYIVSLGKVNPKRAHAKHIFSTLEQKFGIKFSFSSSTVPLIDESDKV